MSFKIVCELLDKLTPEEKQILIEKLTIPKEHKCQFMIAADWTHLTCKCGKRINPDEL